MKSRGMSWMGHKVPKGDAKCVKIVAGKPEGKRPLRRQRRRWEDNIKMYLTEIGFVFVDWICLAQEGDR
jgi:hypothetical protein